MNAYAARFVGSQSLGVIPDAAGAVAGVAILEQYVRALSTEAPHALGSGARLDPANFASIQARIANNTLGDRIPARDVKDFVLGTIARMADAAARARQLSQIHVASEADRDRNYAAQRAVLGPAALMGDKAREALRDMTFIRSAGTAGLGDFGAVSIPVIVGVVACILGAIAIVALAQWKDANDRLSFASREAERICAASGGCSASERARITRDLTQGGAFQSFAANIGANLGIAIGVAALAGIGYAVWKSRSRRSGGL